MALLGLGVQLGLGRAILIHRPPLCMESGGLSRFWFLGKEAPASSRAGCRSATLRRMSAALDGTSMLNDRWPLAPLPRPGINHDEWSEDCLPDAR